MQYYLSISVKYHGIIIIIVDMVMHVIKEMVQKIMIIIILLKVEYYIKNFVHNFSIAMINNCKLFKPNFVSRHRRKANSTVHCNNGR